jgi:hypothetical protein
MGSMLKLSKVGALCLCELFEKGRRVWQVYETTDICLLWSLYVMKNFILK